MPDRLMEPELEHELLREVHRVARIGTWEASSEERLIWSDETLELFGVDRATFRGTIDEFYQLVHPDDVERVRLVADFTDSRNSDFRSEYRIIRPDGELRHIRQTAIVLRDETGAPQGFSGVVQDVTEQVSTEAQLRQAQKMEMIGQLSGGVAHDFNNILAVILGAANLLQEEKAYNEELVDSVEKAVMRGKELTHRLLAFARKQPLRTTQFSVATLVEGMAPMLDRMVGQDIQLDLDLPGDLWRVEADPSPLEEALLNLAVNARDAISGAGRITIACRNKVLDDPAEDAGDYVEILVSDNGEGMADDIRAKACDPFFTTKPVGKGSGLGLSMVEGYVRQTGGQIQIASTEGEGTRISLFMPRAREAAKPAPPPLAEIKQGAGETVLVIDDNEDLAQLFVKQLTSLNYQAVYATDRAAAMRLADQAGGFDIVVSDVLLADGDRGPAVVEALLARHPGMKTVFMTGFAPEEDAAAEAGLANAILLKKPFSLNHLSDVMHRIVHLATV